MASLPYIVRHSGRRDASFFSNVLLSTPGTPYSPITFYSRQEPSSESSTVRALQRRDTLRDPGIQGIIQGDLEVVSLE